MKKLHRKLMPKIFYKNDRELSLRNFVYCAIFVAIAAVVLNTAYNPVFSKGNNKNPQLEWLSYNQLLEANKIPQAGKIIEINFSYDADAQSALKIAKINKKNGYAPLYEFSEDGYILEVINNAGKVVKNLTFKIPDRIDGPPPLKGEKQLNQILVLKKVDFALTIEWAASASEVRIITPDGMLVESRSLANISEIDNKPNFKSFHGGNFRSAASQTFLDFDNFIAAALAEATSSQGALDITFIGDDYLTADDLNKFNNDVNRFISYQLSYEPFKSRATQIVFHSVSNTADLGCAYNGRLIVCNNSLVVQGVNSAGAPYDKIIVIVNNSAYGGSGGSLIAVSYNGISGQQVFVHEFGHTIGSLLDEYNLYTADGLLDNYVHINCFAGTPPTAEWANLVALADYSLGCYYPNWYRSSPGSIMINLDYEFFNAVSQKYINNAFNYFAGVFTDAIFPVSSITLPLDGSLVSGMVTVTTNITDNNGIARAELWKDGELFRTAYAAPFSFSWQTTQDADGYHAIQIKAYDVTGNAGISPTTTVTVNNYSDITPPTVIINSPPDGSRLKTKGSLKISASVSDANGINSMQLFLDGSNLKTCFFMTSCFTSVSISSLTLGSHLISAKAYDPAGNIGESTIIIYK